MPKTLFCDNGSEFTSHAMDLWAYQNGAKIDFSRPGKPTGNAFVERFNGTFRSECLTELDFQSAGFDLIRRNRNLETVFGLSELPVLNK